VRSTVNANSFVLGPAVTWKHTHQTKPAQSTAKRGHRAAGARCVPRWAMRGGRVAGAGGALHGARIVCDAMRCARAGCIRAVRCAARDAMRGSVRCAARDAMRCAALRCELVAVACAVGAMLLNARACSLQRATMVFFGGWVGLMNGWKGGRRDGWMAVWVDGWV
jgi:hypothetical protein